MQGVLEIGGADDNSVKVFHGIQFIVVYACLDVVSELLLQHCLARFSLVLPDIGHGNHVIIQFLVMVQEAGKQGTPEAIGETYDPNINAIIGSNNTCVTGCAKGESAHCGCTGCFNEFPSCFFHS